MLNTIHEYFRNSSLLTGTILNSVPAKFVLFKLLFVNNYLFKGLLATQGVTWADSAIRPGTLPGGPSSPAR